MNIEEIKELSNKLKGVTRTLEFMENYMSLLNTLVTKDVSIHDKAMTLYLTLENEGMLSVMQDQLDEVSNITSEADNFIFKVAEDLENEKLVPSCGGKA